MCRGMQVWSHPMIIDRLHCHVTCTCLYLLLKFIRIVAGKEYNIFKVSLNSVHSYIDTSTNGYLNRCLERPRKETFGEGGICNKFIDQFRRFTSILSYFPCGTRAQTIKVCSLLSCLSLLVDGNIICVSFYSFHNCKG